MEGGVANQPLLVSE